MDLNLVQGDKNGSICIPLHAEHQLELHHLLKMLSLFLLYVFGFVVKAQVALRMCIYFKVFNSIPLMYLSVSVPIPCGFYHYCSVIQVEDRDDVSPRGSFIVENYFGYPGFLLLHINLKVSLSL